MLPNSIQLAGRTCSAAHGTVEGISTMQTNNNNDSTVSCSRKDSMLFLEMRIGGLNATFNLKEDSNRDPSCDKEEEEESFQPLKDSTETEGFPGEEE